MENYPKIRIYVDTKLQVGSNVQLSADHSHYLINVMRQKIGNKLLIFNGKDGEFLASIITASKKNSVIDIINQTKLQKNSPDIWLCFAPVKNAPINNIARQATELGVSKLQPVITKNTVISRVNVKRLSANAIEASEQSRRLDVPDVEEPVSLDDLLVNWDKGRKLILCDESGSGAIMIDKLLECQKKDKYAILIGPEGGFSQSEFEKLRNHPYIIQVCMGPRILRADTAAIVSLANVFGVLGDWDAKPDFR